MNNHEGKYIEPKDWQKFTSQKDVFTIDVRNDYEIEVGTFKNSFSPKTKNETNWPFNKPFYLIFNLAIGGHFGGHDIDDSIFPTEFLVDYVKVYKN